MPPRRTTVVMIAVSVLDLASRVAGSDAASAELVGHVAGATRSIRVGSGCVMLPNQAPLPAGEQFGTLATPYAGHMGLAMQPGMQPTPQDPVRLRPHHLLCLLTYAGKGYSEAFTAGFDAVVARLSQGAPVVLVDGPDDICAPLQHDATAHCHRDSVRQRDRQAAADLAALLQQPVGPGVVLAVDDATLQAWRQAFGA
jgi:hypothetical protein